MSSSRTVDDAAGGGVTVTGYKRVLLKLSGEVFGGGKVGVDPDVVSGIAADVGIVWADLLSTATGKLSEAPDGQRFRGTEPFRDRAA